MKRMAGAVFSDKTPPPFNRMTDDYLKWKRKLELWCDITDVAAEKQATLTVLRLDDDTQAAVLDLMTSAQLKLATGVTTLKEHMDEMFKKEAMKPTTEPFVSLKQEEQRRRRR